MRVFGCLLLPVSLSLSLDLSLGFAGIVEFVGKDERGIRLLEAKADIDAKYLSGGRTL